jgi:hypothetical protein
MLILGPVNQTLPFVPMNIVAHTGYDDEKEIISEEQQSPLISTLEQREDDEQIFVEPVKLLLSEVIIPMSIDVDSKPIDMNMITALVCFLTDSDYVFSIYSID